MQAERIHVRDVMQSRVIKLDASASVTDAIESLRDAGVRGAPVVDAAGALVGVVSITDLLEASASAASEVGGRRREYYLADPLEENFDEDADDFGAKGDFSPEVLADGRVAEWMNPDVLSISPDATLREACRQMAEHRVHRLVVVDGGSLVGILSTFDVVRCVAERG
ncbi:CBS domain-containing protein [Engelhardtia mirabilis]|uniref:Inosine 5-monophosphate dehydrogenase n=1 Tax=Engelhardtia mirabilis TaxID=2528011 RepID=A0A518BER9_9BACT|nr:inosine 5-monophosphate dehydrogenase [Planctomycetes bacterium Pla133]QDU99806.1 inosine 5-monophosphate dehydrogenase [Planctomycetes bacterium Pla86]